MAAIVLRRIVNAPAQIIPRYLLSGAFIVVLAASGETVEAPNRGQKFDQASLEFFEKSVRPILAERCYECHSAQARKLKGKLHLDSRAGVLAGGETGPVVVPGRPQDSLLIEAVGYRNPDLQMPPKTRLTDREVATLTQWIERGLPWPEESAAAPPRSQGGFDLEKRRAEHWAWKPVTRPEPPPVKNRSWPRNEVDRFILAALEAKGLQPAPPADKRVLIRRVYFDLIGLPPSAEEVESFVRDPSPAAYERVVEELLGSPQFGERWARHWLDLVRYAETRGHEIEPLIPNAYQYRDYLIRAFNADVPYDRFVTEHIAGDLLKHPRLDPGTGANESILGTGFWFLGEEVHSPMDIRQDEADRLDNRLDVMGKTFLGLTVGCARCHDHKFDAISQADYYALTGFLLSSTYRQVRFESQERNRPIAVELDRMRSQAKGLLPDLAAAERPGIERLSDYLLAAREAMHPTLEASNAVPCPGGPERTPQGNLNAELVGRWVTELRAAAGDEKHPFHLFAEMAAEARADDADRFAILLKPWREKAREAAERAAHPLKPEQVIVDYATAGPGQWYADGFSFGLRPVRTGDVLLSKDPQNPIAGIVDGGAARRDSAWYGLKLAEGTERDYGTMGGWDRPGRTLRTRKVTLKSGRLWYRAKGAGRAYAVVDSHLVVAGPLHGRVLMEWDGKPDEWQWVEHDLRPYRGHRAHVEFTPRSADGPLSIARVVESESDPRTSPSPNLRLFQAVTAPGVTNPAALAEAYRDLLLQVDQALGEGRLAKSERAEDTARLASWMATHAGLFSAPGCGAMRPLVEAAAPLIQRRAELIGRIRTQSHSALAMFEGNGVDENILIRGSTHTPGERVPRRFLEALGGAPPEGYGPGSGRERLAAQMLAEDNPLTSRVMVNRVWSHLFGRGLVPTVDNFGVLGERPSHPELLDWLADTFRHEQGWSVKRLIKSLVLSSTYRMSSENNARAAAGDPENRLWHRMPVRRLEAEAIRDAILSVSGRLDPAVLGPPVEVYLTSFMEGRGRPGTSGPLDGAGRRSIYTKIRRNFLPPMMLAFDMPIPFTTFGRRTVSNVPAQALTLMNDPFVIEQSRAWARRVLERNRTAGQRIQSMYLTAFARPPREDELKGARAFLEEQAEAYGVPAAGRLEDARVWSDLAHVLFNTKEFIFIR
jgi:Protein of unknown function (DUF1553)/Protein of unknown function (DUF1549)/Planctomycete cytochrome C